MPIPYLVEIARRGHLSLTDLAAMATCQKQLADAESEHHEHLLATTPTIETCLAGKTEIEDEQAVRPAVDRTRSRGSLPERG